MTFSPGKLFISAIVTAGIFSAYLKVASDNQSLSGTMNTSLPPAVLSDVATRETFSPDTESHIEKARHQLALNRYFSPQTNNETPTQADHFTDTSLDNSLDNSKSLGLHDDQAIWSLIEKLERDQRIFAYEALSLKLRWLEKNVSDSDELKLRSDSLIKSYNRES